MAGNRYMVPIEDCAWCCCVAKDKPEIRLQNPESGFFEYRLRLFPNS